MQQNLNYLNRHNFRAICNALAMPGTSHTLQKAFDSYVIAFASVLLYTEVSYTNLTDEDFWVLKSLCNAREENIDNADYIFTRSLNPTLLDITKIKKGSFKDPEFSASIIYCYDDKEDLYPYKLSGAGINGSLLQNYPLTHKQAQDFLAQNVNFPIGYEMYFLHKQNCSLLALSRTTQVEAV